MAFNFSTEQDLVTEALKVFKREFMGQVPEIAACAPGRVNLIGDHTDYNDGFVFPMALPLLTVTVGKKNDTDKCVVVTEAKDTDKPVKVEFSVPTKETLAPGNPKWANYVKGVVQYFRGTVVGFNAVIVTSVPIGGGLSSSASLEVSVYTFLEALTGETGTTNKTLEQVLQMKKGGDTIPGLDNLLKIVTRKFVKKKKDKALLCQKAEHEFANMPCGIMDQFISVMGQSGTALLIDCRSMQETAIPITDPEIAVIITNSNVKRSLASSAYAERLEQCQSAAKTLGKSSLRDVSENDVEVLKEKHPLLYKRAKHVVTENKRTEQAAEALKQGDLKTCGELMTASHESLKTDYEVSCTELDELVAAALEVDGVLGSRMTGGGFGGCTVTLAPKTIAHKVIENMKKKYKGKPTFYITEPCEGARVLTLPE